MTQDKKLRTKAHLTRFNLNSHKFRELSKPAVATGVFFRREMHVHAREQIVWKQIEFSGQTRGGAFAGASAGYGVGAGAAIGGNTDENGGSGGIGSQAHAGRFNTKTVQLSRTPQQQPHQVRHVISVNGYHLRAQ